PGGYPDYIANHERRPGIGPLAGWRGREGDMDGAGPANPRQLDKYVANQCFWQYELPHEALYYKHCNKAYLEIAQRFGFVDRAEQIVLQLYCEPLQKFRLAAQGHGAVQPPDRLRARVAAAFDPLPTWYAPLSEAAISAAEFPLHAITQRPMPMYHSWGSQNAWLRQIIGLNRLYVNRTTGQTLGLADDDWAWVISHHGRVKVQVRLMEGCEPGTVWTWNAIGKRAGAWNLAPASHEARQGFLLNHVIPELLPERDGMRLSNSDPVTGQAAWYDVRVRLEKCAPADAGETAPLLPPLAPPPDLRARPSLLRYGAEWRR